MPEEQDKKINYKILTAEEILKEAQVPAKEIEHHEEKVEVPVTERIEKKIETSPAEKIEERVEVIRTEKKEEGILYPESQEESVEFESIISQPIQKTETQTGFSRSIPSIIEEEKPSVEKSEEKSEEGILYFRSEEEKPLSQKLKESQAIETRGGPRFNLNLTYLFIGAIAIISIAGLFFLKPQQKIIALLESKKIQKATTSTSTKISFPTINVSTPTVQSIKVMPPSPTPTQVSLPKMSVSTPTQQKSTSVVITETKTALISGIRKEIMPSKYLNLPGVIKVVQKQEFTSFLSNQEFFGTKLNIDLVDGNRRLPVDFLFDYFIKNKNSQELKNELTGNYGLLIYYGYTRKYPILIFEVHNKEKVNEFNQNWEQTTMKDELQTLFLGSIPSTTTNIFQTKTLDQFSYRILDFGNNYKIIWTIVGNYLIYSTTETGIKDLISYLQ